MVKVTVLQRFSRTIVIVHEIHLDTTGAAVAHCPIGGVSPRPARLSRLSRIGSLGWTLYWSDRRAGVDGHNGTRDVAGVV
jgi:hypothetical protein